MSLSRAGVLGTIVVLIALAPVPTLARTQVSGTVTDEAGRPVEGAEVRLEPLADPGDGEPVTATTNRIGGYLISPLPAGEYRVSARSEGLTIRGVEARAVRSDNSEAWTLDAAAEPFRVEDGMKITCDLVVGEAFEVTASDGASRMLRPDEALDELTGRVRTGDCAGALPQMERYGAAYPDVAKVHYLTGFCRASLGRNEAAVEALDRALELQPAFPGAPLLRGQVLARAGEVDAAAASLRQEIDLAASPQLVRDSWIALGVLYRDHDRTDEAVEAFRNVVRLAPERPESYAELATLHADRGETDEAAEVLEAARTAGAVPVQAGLKVAIAHFDTKDYDGASTALRTVIDAGAPRDDLATAYALLGRCQIKQGRNDEAVRSLAKSLELDPGSRLAAESRTLLDSLRP